MQFMPSFIKNTFLFLPFNFKQDFRVFTAITKHGVTGHSEEILHSTANFDTSTDRATFITDYDHKVSFVRQLLCR